MEVIQQIPLRDVTLIIVDDGGLEVSVTYNSMTEELLCDTCSAKDCEHVRVATAQ